MSPEGESYRQVSPSEYRRLEDATESPMTPEQINESQIREDTFFEDNKRVQGAEIDMPAEIDFSDVDTFADLFDRIIENDGLISSFGHETSDYWVTRVEKVRSGEETADFLTRKFGLREKVKELIEIENTQRIDGVLGNLSYYLHVKKELGHSNLRFESQQNERAALDLLNDLGYNVAEGWRSLSTDQVSTIRLSLGQGREQLINTIIEKNIPLANIHYDER